MSPSPLSEHDHVLPDGTTVHMRPIHPSDGPALLAMWARTSEDSRRLRFHGAFRLDTDNVERFTDLDPAREFALVATTGRGDDEQLIGVARWVRDDGDPTFAEFAALVEDAHQRRGIGTALVRHVARDAHDVGIRTLSGDVLSHNNAMLRLVRDLGLAHRDIRESEVVRTDLGLDFGEDFLLVLDESERTAARAALDRFFRPTSIAVVGASRDATAIGGLVFRHLLRGEFLGVVHPVNPNADVIQSVRAYPCLSALPDVPDLVYVCVPARFVADVVDEAGSLGIRAVCIISAGFSEAGAEGRARHVELMARARGHGLRIVGPNCMGIMNAGDDVRMNGTFSDTFPRSGNLAFSSQSGALGLAVIEHVHTLGLGLSSFVSVGNKADISGNDLLLYWEEDDATDVILLYLESFGNPRKFSRIARRISRHKPIVAVKSGRTSAGVRAASSHTAAISSGDVAVSALFEQTGVIRTDTLEELFDVATLLSTQSLPKGRRVVIVTNAGGPGILAADACESNGLSVPALSSEVQTSLRAFLPPEAGLGNPVDMIASASAAGYRQAIEVVGGSGEVDAVVVIFIPTGTTETTEIAAAISAAAGTLGDAVSVVSVFMGSRGLPPELAEAGVPSFAFPEDAARALGRVAQHAVWRAKPLGTVRQFDDLDRDAARAIVDAALASAPEPDEARQDGEGDPGADAAHEADHGVWLSAEDASRVLEAYGVPQARSRIVATAEEAAGAQRDFGVPVAVKVAAPIHKKDIGGLALGLDSPEAAAAAVEQMEDALRSAGMEQHLGAYLVQEMVSGGIEMVVGVASDPSFGPIVMTGMGGSLVELLRDVSVRITPLTDRDVDEMIDGLKMRPLLSGYRGDPPADEAALKDLIHRIGAMVEDLPEVVELDINPVFVRDTGNGVVAVDVRMKVQPPQRPTSTVPV